MSQKFDVIIIGAGAAGVFAGINIKTINPQLSVTILEKSKNALSKVKVSGGGRCNVTHACFDPSELIKFYPRGSRELRGPFSNFQPGDTIAWFADRGIELKIEDDGRMFPTTDSSQTIIDCFYKELNQLNIPIIYQTKVDSITKTDEGFNLGDYECSYCIVTTGGFNKIEQYRFIKDLDINIIPPAPSLFTFNLPKHPILKLQGLVSNSSVKIHGTKFSDFGPLLITHWGMSGPAILKLSSWAARELQAKDYTFTFSVNWATNHSQESLREFLEAFKTNNAAKKIQNALPLEIPKKLHYYLFEKSQINLEKKWGEISKKELNKFIEMVLNDQYQSQGKTTFKQEFVSCGGVDLKEVDFKTMQSKKVKNLYFAGEVLDIDALTGGFNFQAAWTTAYLAALSIAE